MAIETSIKPSPRARELFGRMVARSNNKSRSAPHITIAQTLELSVDRVKDGKRDHQEIRELQQQGWIQQAHDGGWILLS